VILAGGGSAAGAAPESSTAANKGRTELRSACFNSSDFSEDLQPGWHVPELAKGVEGAKPRPSGTVRSMVGSGTCHPNPDYSGLPRGCQGPHDDHTGWRCEVLARIPSTLRGTAAYQESAGVWTTATCNSGNRTRY